MYSYIYYGIVIDSNLNRSKHIGTIKNKKYWMYYLIKGIFLIKKIIILFVYMLGVACCAREEQIKNV